MIEEQACSLVTDGREQVGFLTLSLLPGSWELGSLFQQEAPGSEEEAHPSPRADEDVLLLREGEHPLHHLRCQVFGWCDLPPVSPPPKPWVVWEGWRRPKLPGRPESMTLLGLCWNPRLSSVLISVLPRPWGRWQLLVLPLPHTSLGKFSLTGLCSARC